ncbi:chitobiase/beta-hexosaminidase C-terminal domain-containing protein [Myxococcus qinghaiensis]|uniref:chitobiase/beta-hexosaminidase C-terminal domain-containing protein n=1 Tax=Myxococcus qinghaiensis TaxID=2906758 RepID=UPI0020A754F8|nr:chitobiase/beta-hexosaminidase C-terminal domain-containing protein [Myxococcus qinghaiensis]MCP3167932.1 chitobiase/beta-hexosaminidase C-terminal domain-containing protein [Myxococcus qinghaiensis]
MSLTLSWPLRLCVVFLSARFVLACSGGESPPPNPSDLAPPTTRVTPAGGEFTTPVAVTLVCDDGGGSGCAATHYTLDGSAPTQASPRYTSPLSIAQTATLRFFSVDRVGNPEAVQQARYVVDTQAPQVVATPRSGSFATSRAVTLTCDDGEGSGCVAIHYTTDGGIPSRQSPVYQEPLLLTATTLVRFIAVDRMGNVSEVVSEEYTRDTSAEDSTAPTTTAAPAGGVYRSAQAVVLSCVDDAAGSGCAGTYYTVDGSAPTTSSPRYTGPITVAASTTLRFLSTDIAGNVELAKTEQYNLDTTPPVTTATPLGGVYDDAVSVTLTCGDSGSGCAETRYTLDGSAPSASSPLYAAPIPLTASLRVRFASTDLAGNVEQVNQESYVLQASAQLQAVRDAANGAVNLVIDGARITFLKEGVGDLTRDPAGFFLQAERTGPALFVPVDPSTLSPVPRVGDRVRVTVNAKSVVNGQTRASISSFSVLGGGRPVAEFLQDVSDVNVTTGGTQPVHESEYISITGTIGMPGFSASGAGHLEAPFTTVGVPSGSAAASWLRLRLVEPLRDSLALTAGCSLTVTSPLWVFMPDSQSRPTLQPSVWTASDVTVHGCPAPRVIDASTPDRNTVRVRFSRPLDPASLVASGSQFSIPGLSVTQAQLEDDTEVVLTTSNHSAYQPYTLTVATTVRDRRGVSLDPTATQASFRGFVRPPARLLLSEVAPNVANERDLVELYVLEAGSTENATLMEGDTTLATLPDALVAAGDLIVIHLNPDRVTPGMDAPASETLGKTQHPASSYSTNYDNAWDFHGGAMGVGVGNRTLRIRNVFTVTQDGVAAVLTAATLAGYPPHLQALQAEGQWSPANCGGVPCTYESSPSALNVSAEWTAAFLSSQTNTFQRHGITDSNTRADWTNTAPSLGQLND